MGMKTISAVVITTALLGAATTFAHPPCGDIPQMPPLRWECGPPQPALPPVPPAIHDRVEALMDAEQMKALPLLQKLQKNRRSLQKAIEAKPFNEAAVTALAAEQARLQTDLLVIRLRTQSRIQDLLDQSRPPQK
jgi:Spy/CpxP family protein refolding chaperone